MKQFFINLGHKLKAFFIKLGKILLPALTLGLSSLYKYIRNNWNKQK